MKQNPQREISHGNNLEIKALEAMLRVAIGGLIENEICSYCKIRHDEDAKSRLCNGFERCEQLIFEGLLFNWTNNRTEKK